MSTKFSLPDQPKPVAKSGRSLANSALLGVFIITQVYFISNLLSYSIWQIGLAGVIYTVIYFGAWILVLAVLLFLFLQLGRTVKRPQTTVLAMAILSLPMFGIWLQILNFHNRWLEYSVILSYPLVAYVYFRAGLGNTRKIMILTGGLIILSLFSHSELSSHLVHSEKFEDFGETQLATKPNIHIVMFEALTTSAFSEEALSIPNPASDYMSKMSDALFASNRGFTEAFPTRNSWNTVFNLGIENPWSGSVFSGLLASPLTTLLRNNGYRIQTGTTITHLGRGKGKYVDVFHLPLNRWKYAGGLACEQKLLGFCHQLPGRIYDWIYAFIHGTDDTRADYQLFEDHVVESIREFERDADSPVFSAFHILVPGHWSTTQPMSAQNLNKFRDHYALGVDRVLNALRQIDQLRKDLSDSVFIISGDHGPLLAYYGGLNSEDRRFFVLDSYHVALAVLNVSNLCDIERHLLDQVNVLTPPIVLAATLSCNGNPDHLMDNVLSAFQQDSEFAQIGLTLGR